MQSTAADLESTLGKNQGKSSPPNGTEPRPSPKADRDAEHFSPDPFQATDRYRLVTPYHDPRPR